MAIHISVCGRDCRIVAHSSQEKNKTEFFLLTFVHSLWQRELERTWHGTGSEFRALREMRLFWNS